MFSITGECGSARTGLLTTARGSIATPAMLLTFRRGDPHALMPDSLERLPEPVGAMVNPYDFADHKKCEVLGKSANGVRDFWALSQPCVFSMPRDPVSYQFGVKPSKNWGVHVMVHTGGLVVPNNEYIAMNETLSADYYMSMCDEVVSKATRKRTKLSVDRTIKWLDESLKKRTNNGDGPKLLAPIAGGTILEERLRSAKEASKRNADGYVLCGFGTGESKEERATILKAVLGELPHDRLRMIVGLGGPDEVLEAVSLGIDFFDSGYVWNVSEGKYALTFPLDLAEDLSNGRGNVAEGQDDMKLNMLATSHRLDKRPLVEGCDCYCCKRHSRAYVHHLLQCSEILGEVLLNMHNLHHMMQFFSMIRQKIKGGGLEDYRARLLRRREVFAGV